MNIDYQLNLIKEEHYHQSSGKAGLHAFVSEELISWLSRLRMLEGVPFRYLVPSEEILPNESIRFFHIDRNWLDALVDGAMSVARTGSREVEFDNARYEDLMADLHHFERDRRKFSNKLLSSHVCESRGIDDLELPAGGTLTGFIFRSTVVRDWPGIEVSAYDELLVGLNQVPVNPYQPMYRVQTMRQEKLSDSVLLCIFNGTPSHVRIQEPYEGMRVGVDTEDATDENGMPYRTNLKDLDANFLCAWCDGVIDTADEPPECSTPSHNYPCSCNACYSTSYMVSNYNGVTKCSDCDGGVLQGPSGSNEGDKFRGYDVFTRKQTGDNSVLNIQGIYDKAKEQLEGTRGPGVSSITENPIPQDSALLAIQLLQFPYQQDFECRNAFSYSVNDNPTDTSGGA